MSYIKEPQIYLSSELKVGEQCVVHKFSDKSGFVSLKFSDEGETKNIPNLIVEDKFILSNKKIRTQLQEIENNIVKLDGIYTCYGYLFSVIDQCVYLLSLSSNSKTLSFKMVKKVSTTLNLPTMPPNYVGVYTPFLVNAFVEDIFIQTF